ncbi:hypothetical protein D3C84_909560 [compost metagenome]
MKAEISWPKLIGVASIMWVRPVLTSFMWRAASSASPPDSSLIAGSKCCCTAWTAAMCMAVGKQSLELWERLT